MKIPHQRYHHDVAGMPCFAAEDTFIVHVPAEAMEDAVPQDDENCAIALGCKMQLNTPYVSVGRFRTDLALPHPQGVVKPGYGKTTWAVIRFQNSAAARKVIIDADTGDLDPNGAMLELHAAATNALPKVQKARNKKKRATRKKNKIDRSNELTEMGVRILTGQRQR